MSAHTVAPARPPSALGKKRDRLKERPCGAHRLGDKGEVRQQQVRARLWGNRTSESSPAVLEELKVTNAVSQQFHHHVIS